MPDALFTQVKPTKRKRSQPTVSHSTSGKPKSRKAQFSSRTPSSSRHDRDNYDSGDQNSEKDEAIGAFDDIDLDVPAFDEGSGDEYDDETPAQKRLRLAKLYLDSIKRGRGGVQDEGMEEVEGWDAEEIDRELIESRLQRDVLEHSGRVHSYVGDAVGANAADASILRLKAHRLPVTAAVMSEDGRLLYSASKEGSIVQWDLHSGRRTTTIPKLRQEGKGKGKGKAKEISIEGHTDEVWTLAISSDGKYLVSGGKDRRVAIWDAVEAKWIKSFAGHKDSISSLCFRKGSHQLFTASHDRTIKIFDLSPHVMGYVETLFGHQDVINSIDSLRSETAVSSGARDRTVRFWKVVEENQLVFRGGGRSALRDVLEGIAVDEADPDETELAAELRKERVRQRVQDRAHLEGSIECVAMIDETTFLSGGDSGAIRLWSNSKKKAVYTHGLAHGLHQEFSDTEGSIQTPRWITSIASLRYTDVFASGSWDGFIRLWKLDGQNRSFTPLTTIPAAGFVNSLQLVAPPIGSLDSAPWVRTDPPTGEHSPVTGQIGRCHCVVVAALGQEPRLGRWMRIAGEGTGSRNVVLVAAIPYQEHPLHAAT